MNESRKLRVFLCHASQDKPIVRELYQKLLAENWIDPWLDEEKLLPGQDWNLEIEKAVESSDAVIVCLSDKSVNKEGYVQKEIRKVLDISDQKPDGTIFIIPLRLEDCEPPRRLRIWQYVDYFPFERQAWAYQRLLASIKARFDTMDNSKAPLTMGEPAPNGLLTSMEMDVARLLSERKSREQISDELGISTFGVGLIEQKLLLKTGQPTVQKLVVWWKRNYLNKG